MEQSIALASSRAAFQLWAMMNSSAGYWSPTRLARQLREDGAIVQCHRSLARTSRHRQPGQELVLTESGIATVTVGGEHTVVSPGSLVVFQARQWHETIAEGADYRRTVICLTGSAPAWMPRRGALHLRLNASLRRRFIEAVAAIDGELERRQTGWREAVGMRGDLLLLDIRRWAEDVRPGAPAFSPLVRRALALASGDWERPPQLKAIAVALNTSAAHLTRVFRRETGRTFSRYLREERIGEARRLLREHPERPLTEIAHALGFADLAAFSRTFRALEGRPPSAFRQPVEDV